jgi:uncharacterized SAM-binding protein YcdF (DUF218 family)
MTKTKIKSIYFLRLLRNLFIIIGIFFSICILLAFTTLPFEGCYWLGTSKSELKLQPQTIILLGGGEMPSQSALMRCWYTEKAAKSFPNANIIIAMPGDLEDSLSTPQLMKKELLIRGLEANRILFEDEGTNTRAQVLNCQRLVKMQAPILLVTSPEHMRRSVLSFQKAGFENVNALPAFENAIEADLSFNDDKLGGKRKYLPGVGGNISMRYQLWNHLKYEILIVREIVALGYYKLRAWV